MRRATETAAGGGGAGEGVGGMGGARPPLTEGFFGSIPISDAERIVLSAEPIPAEVLAASVRNAAAGGDAASLALTIGRRDDLNELNESAHAYVARQAMKRDVVLDHYARLPLPVGRRADSILRVVGALLELGHRAKRPYSDSEGLTVAASERDLERLSDLSRPTVRRQLGWLIDSGWLTVHLAEERRRSYLATTYTLASPGRLAQLYEPPSFATTPSSSSQCEREGSGQEPVQVSSGHVLWSPKGYGGTGRTVYEALRNNPEGLTITAAARLAGVSRNTSSSRVRQLVEAGLAERVGRLVLPARTDLDAVADDQGLAEWREQRGRRIEREQSNWRATVTAPPASTGVVVDLAQRAQQRRDQRASRCPYFAAGPIGEVAVTIRAATVRAVS